VLPEENKKYFGREGDGIHMMFNFYVNQHLFYALATGEIEPLAEALLASRSLAPSSQWAQFLRNHDELDLGRLRKCNGKPSSPGLARKSACGVTIVASVAGSPQCSATVHNSSSPTVFFFLSLAPQFYATAMIGMGDDLSLKERNAVRTPMRSNAAQGGFSTARKTVRPILDEGPFGFREVNVEAQRREEGSLLNWMTAMIRLRKECPEIGWGEWSLVKTTAPGVLGLSYEWKGNALIVLHNFTARPKEARVRLSRKDENILTDVRQNEESHAGDDGRHRLALEAYGYRWYRIGALDHLLHRQKT
jgi:maltose alpha-D-glucosyltransferase/alpha-amylase